MSCEHDCARPPLFPRPIANRPALDTIDYRIGDYAAMRAHMVSAIDAAPQLSGWTHRMADDPGIALIEAAATAGDILAFYQHVYANEAYLRTAKWRESVAELVRPLGYRLAPGLGGRARFALAVKGERPVRIPAGFALSVDLPKAPRPATFETAVELEARPELSKFRLYRPRFVPWIANGADTFQLDPENDIALAAGDRLLVGIAEGRTLTHTQVLVIDEVRTAFGVREVKTRGRVACLLDAPLAAPSAFPPRMPTPAEREDARFGLVGTMLRPGLLRPPALTLLDAGLGMPQLQRVAELRAYKLGSSVRHFGHNAPATRVVIDSQGRASEVAVSYVRRLDAIQGAPAAPQLRPRQLPLEREVGELTAGTSVLVEANLSASSGGAGARKRLLERGVTQVDRQSLAWGSMSGASTVLQLDDDLAIADAGAALAYADVRGVTVHQVHGEGFRLRSAARATPAGAGSALDFYGMRADAEALAGRTLLLGLPQGPLAANVLAVDSAGEAPQPRFFRATLDRELDYALFEQGPAPRVAAYGNLVEATEGKSEAEVALGDGDARKEFQTFALPKAPLTYLLDTASSPPHVPQLEVWVDRVRWQRVDSFFGREPREAIYVVREGSDRKSFVQFGDGRTGARLPSGRGNVVARYRTGSGARGLPEADKKPSAQRKLPGFDDLWMLEPAAGGAAPESAANARLAAPASMQSLGRIVSLADYEAEALALPGVLKARAAWTILDGTSLVSLTVLSSAGGAGEAQAVDAALRRALSARGPARCALQVTVGERKPVRIRLTVAHDEMRRAADLAEAIAAALGVEDDDPADDLDTGARGLLHWRMRNFGEGVHDSQVAAAAQSIDGVVWVRVDRLEPARALPHELLSLARADLVLDFVAASGKAAFP
jgi:predicted phage baseplate assembly protein